MHLQVLYLYIRSAIIITINMHKYIYLINYSFIFYHTLRKHPLNPIYPRYHPIHYYDCNNIIVTLTRKPHLLVLWKAEPPQWVPANRTDLCTCVYRRWTHTVGSVLPTLLRTPLLCRRPTAIFPQLNRKISLMKIFGVKI